jgi:hypothetical protein
LAAVPFAGWDFSRIDADAMRKANRKFFVHYFTPGSDHVMGESPEQAAARRAAYPLPVPSRPLQPSVPPRDLAVERAAAPADVVPLLPPDPDAVGSLHWLQGQVGEVFAARWRGAGTWTVMLRVMAEHVSPERLAANRWRYHSPIAVPAPMPADPADAASALDAELMWRATVEMSKP